MPTALPIYGFKSLREMFRECEKAADALCPNCPQGYKKIKHWGCIAGMNPRLFDCYSARRKKKEEKVG